MCLWVSVTLVGCSGGDDEYPWPWQDEAPPAPAADFAGMWDYDPAKGIVAAGWEGIVVIEWPCVFAVGDINDASSPPRRAVVELPEDYTRYDPRTRSMWVFAVGPITTGDRVVATGTGRQSRSQELHVECPAGEQLRAGHMDLCPQPGWCTDAIRRGRP